MLNFYSQRKLWGTYRIYKETIDFDKVVREVFEEAKKSERINSPMAVFAYGSPGRYELTGGDSDADILIAEPSTNEESDRLKKILKDRWGAFDFSKVDVPPWSTYEDIETFLRTSLVEGNQVLETRFICGDDSVREEIESQKKKYDSPHRELVNIIFNRLYFDQYFKQRVRNGAKNIKYCNGGTRDFLVFYWYDRLCRKVDGEDTSLSGLKQPKIKEGLERLMMEGAINGEQFGRAIEAVNGLIELRTDALIANRGTEERGLSVLDDKLIQKLQKDFQYPAKGRVMDFFEYVTHSINEVVKISLERTLDIGSTFYGNKWKERIKSAYSTETPREERLRIPDIDSPTRIALLWGASNSGDLEGFQTLSKRYTNTTDWGTIASIACSPFCSPDTLHEIGTGIAKENGYGYILRIVGRNSNTGEKTLREIAEDPRLDKRYTEVAKTALEHGTQKANNLI
jgi:hypothetical protein|tara:strand:- start:81 stop:1448 length:1368 start_codon:yes stop_codon:yes gene_type:complete